MATANSKYTLAPIQSSYVNDGGQDVAGLLRQRYDVNKQKYDMIERSAKNLDVLAGDQHHKDGAIQGIHDGIADVARRGNYESAGGDIDELANSFATNQGLQAASDSYAKRQEELKLQANITAQGGQIVDFGNITDEEGNVIGHKSDSHQSYWTDENGEIHTDVYKGGAEHRLDTAAKMKSLIGTIAKDAIGLTRLEGDIAGFLKYGSQVSKRKADRVASDLYESYLSTDEGTQQMRELTELNKMTVDEAQSEIVGQLQAAAANQIGHTFQYMKDPSYVAAVPAGNGNAASMTGGVAQSQGLDLFTDLNKSLADLNRKIREEKDPAKQQLLATELRAQNIKLQNARRKAALASPNEKVRNAAQTEAQLFSAENNRFSILQAPLEALSRNDWYVDSEMAMNAFNPFGDSSMGTYTNTNLIGKSEIDFNNVSRTLEPESWERDNLKMMFSDFDALNNAFGTDYTADDIPKLKKLADDYYTYMHEQNGQDLTDYVESSIEIKQDDRIVFGVEGTKELAKVNNMFKQVDAFNDFILMGADGLTLSADEEEDMREKLLNDQKNGNVSFGGIVMPNMWSGTNASLFLNVNGQSVRAIPKPSSSPYATPIMNQIAGALGLESLYNVRNQQNAAAESGDYSNSQVEASYLSAAGLSTPRDAETGEIKEGAALGLIDRPGFVEALEAGTLSDWSIANGLNTSAVLQSSITLRELETSKLREIASLANITWTEKEVRDLDNGIGTPANLAEFERARGVWGGLTYDFN
jgi:hypothetical protein